MKKKVHVGVYYPQFEKAPKNLAKQEGLIALKEHGVDPKYINLKNDGITIRQFNKMVLKVYMAGYDNGVKKARAMTDLEKQGRAIIRMKKIPKNNSVDSGMSTGRKY